jgi:rhamnose utilization protein RhaD (predicted bifunctional aldolase and dehydrogenase)/NAD(P)-dependent dehydrogenase (short-subunit alcohol dehydrogenase family)
MQNLWDSAAAGDSDLEQCAYGSRLLGSDPSLVLHGGGNTSVKSPYRDITGRDIAALWVKGSGWDLASIEPAGFSPLRLDRLLELLELDSLSDADMMRELSAARLDPGAPQPSVESLLHAFLPHAAVQHSHADVIVTLTNLRNGEQTTKEVFGDQIVTIPYVMPGFDLARLVRKTWRVGSSPAGMVLLNHGLFTFGETTEEAYGRHVDLIGRAERYLDAKAPLSGTGPPIANRPEPSALAELRKKVSEAAKAPMIMTRNAEASVAGFVSRPDLASLSTRGPLTPDHVIRTKRVPLVGRDVGRFVADYYEYFTTNRQRTGRQLEMLDPAPRVILDSEWGMFTCGRSATEASIAADIYHHTIPVLERAEDHLGGYVALSAQELFECEYWDLEQAKLRRSGPPPEFAGMIALVTGSASGIGRACAQELLKRGAAVIGFDVTRQESNGAFYGVEVDVADPAAQREAVAAGVERFGGIDVAVIGAGIFGETQRLSALELTQWERVMSVNVDSVASLFRDLEPLLALSPSGGRVAVISSRNVTAPGKGAAAYSASKAALTQLARVAALEWAEFGTRVNIVHPDAVFDTGIWSEELLESRAATYGLTPDEYKRRNLLRTEVTSHAVAMVVVDLCSDRFGVTTGAQVPIDGGNERVI